MLLVAGVFSIKLLFAHIAIGGHVGVITCLQFADADPITQVPSFHKQIMPSDTGLLQSKMLCVSCGSCMQQSLSRDFQSSCAGQLLKMGVFIWS